MLKDLIKCGADQLFFSGFAIDIVKKYIAKPPSDEPLMLHYPSMILMKSGRFKMRTGEGAHDLKKHDLFMLPPKTRFTVMESDGPQFFLIGICPSKMNRGSNCHHTDSLFYMAGREAVKISLQVGEYKVLSLICRLLYAQGKSSEPNDFDAELKHLSANLLSFEMKLIYSKYFKLAALHASRAQRLSLQFLAVLAIHSRTHHNVQFYAGVLYVTSGYLNRMVKHATGKSAKKTIIEAVLAHAVNLLEDSNFTIAEIAEELEFSSLSAFDIFFKKLMFCTPSEYRLKCCREI